MTIGIHRERPLALLKYPKINGLYSCRAEEVINRLDELVEIDVVSNHSRW